VTTFGASFSRSITRITFSNRANDQASGVEVQAYDDIVLAHKINF